MFCMNCGTELPDEANFCWKCGKPQKQTVPAGGSEPVAEPQWETCQIVFAQTHQGFLGKKGMFKVEATGPNGTYSVCQTPEFPVGAEPDRDNLQVQKVHNALVARLKNEGWEITGIRGTKWWESEFSRRVGDGKQYSIDSEWLKQVKAFLSSGNKIEAIKVYRQAHSQVGLKEAKDAVDEIERQMREKSI